jgi:hypothetical protein
MSITQQQIPPEVAAFNSFIFVYRVVVGIGFILTSIIVLLLLLVLHNRQPVKSRFIAPYFGLFFILFRYGYR